MPASALAYEWEMRRRGKGEKQSLCDEFFKVFGKLFSKRGMIASGG